MHTKLSTLYPMEHCLSQAMAGSTLALPTDPRYLDPLSPEPSRECLDIKSDKVHLSGQALLSLMIAPQNDELLTEERL